MTTSLAKDRLQHIAKRIVGADKDPNVGLISTKDVLLESAFNPLTFAVDYVRRLFPIFSWIRRYNLGWLSGDLIAGLTVGMILIPQGMSYAKIATLPPQYGLYSSFVGAITYCLFATSKDVSIGPISVLSLQVANTISRIESEYPGMWTGPQIGTMMALFCGFIVLAFGLLRIGWVVEFVSAPAVSGFATGSAFTIATGQVPGLLGLASRFNTRDDIYKVIINTLKNLPHCTKDAAFGVMGLASLFVIQYGAEYLGRRYPKYKKPFFYFNTARYAFVMIILTLAAYLYAHPRKDEKGNYPIAILKTVPRGFQHTGAITIDTGLVKAIASDLPPATIIMLLEHIAVAKAFGRLNGYKINPNQELVAMGVANCLGTFFNSYPATGAFSRTAVNSKSGARTPLSGIVTGITVILALYALTDAFFWIPTAGLSAVVIAAVSSLVASPGTVYSFWRVSPLECVIWWAAVLVTIFSSIENGLYTAICASAALLLFRVARPEAQVLGRSSVRQADDLEPRQTFVPLPNAPGNGTDLHPNLKIEGLAPGVLVFRPEESILYPNAALVTGRLIDYIKEHTKRGRDPSGVSLSDRMWCDPGPRNGTLEREQDKSKWLLASVVLDFSAVSHIDTTAVHALVDLREEAERWADRQVTFHFCYIVNPWVRRGLVAGRFGLPLSGRPPVLAEVAPIFGPAKGERDAGFLTVDNTPGANDEEGQQHHGDIQPSVLEDGTRGDTRLEGTLLNNLTPYFHYDLLSAIKAAERDAAGEGGSPADSKEKVDESFEEKVEL
ncbi:hypothetical protein FRB99_000951 [Tulasnella sp. 403]|nr:hypothetical protein FRB99_000951 [Tulasnella sp. 403]